jgi:hypothetical protein
MRLAICHEIHYPEHTLAHRRLLKVLSSEMDQAESRLIR